MHLILTCQQATLLVEQRADARLPLTASAALAAHLWLCSYCKRYVAQSGLIGQLALFGARRAAEADLELPAAARARIQQRLDAARGAGSGKNGGTI